MIVSERAQSARSIGVSIAGIRLKLSERHHGNDAIINCSVVIMVGVVIPTIMGTILGPFYVRFILDIFVGNKNVYISEDIFMLQKIT